MVRVARDLTGAATSDLTGDLAECVPDRRTTAIFINCAFDLVAGGRKAPEEI